MVRLAKAAVIAGEELLDRFQRAAFGYFVKQFNPGNGLVADTSRPGSPCSIAVVGFALSCYPVGVERGWMSRADATHRTLAALRFFGDAQQLADPNPISFKGLFYHFLDMNSGKRLWRSELSLIDTALLLMGMLTAGAYFREEIDEEDEIRRRVSEIYLRVDWQWARGGRATLRQGWKPECGFLHYGWEGYSEATILYVLALASPSHPISRESFNAWTSTYQWETLYDHELLYAGPLFIHHYSQAWIDFDGIRDAFMREKNCDYFENSRRATYLQREYARRNPHDFSGYCEDCWGMSAYDGPGFTNKVIGGRKRRFFGYAARGAPFGPDDGTISPCAALASLPFAPELALSALEHVCGRYPEIVKKSVLPSAFNPTFPGATPAGWVCDGSFGLDQGIVVLAIENHRTRFIWRLMRGCAPVSIGLRRAGFTGGWLS
jgi:hypothetical protein